MPIGHHNMNVCSGVGKRRKGVSKNSGPILNLFSPQYDLFYSHCHIRYLTILRIASRFSRRADVIAERPRAASYPPSGFVRKRSLKSFYHPTIRRRRHTVQGRKIFTLSLVHSPHHTFSATFRSTEQNADN